MSSADIFIPEDFLGQEENNEAKVSRKHIIKSDNEAAIECLFVLTRVFGDTSNWPLTSSQMNSFITKHSKGGSSLADWICRGRQKGEFDEKPKTVRKRLMKELIRIQAASTVKGKVYWHEEAISHLLSSQAPVSLPDFVESDCNNAANRTELALQNDKSFRTMQMLVPGVSFVETTEQLDTLENSFPFNTMAVDTSTSLDNVVLSVDCEGVPEDLFLIQVGTPTNTYVFDCVKLGPKKVCDFLRDILTNPHIIKLFHDLHNDAAALASLGDIYEMNGTLDTQLAMEFLTGDTLFGFNRVLQELGTPQHMSKHIMQCQMKNKDLFSQRPLPRDVLQYAVDDVRLLVGAHESLRQRLGGTWETIQLASDMRAQTAARNGGARHICFDVPNSYAIASYELLFVLRPDDMLTPTPLEVSNETDTLLKMLPEDLIVALHENTQRLSDVVMDKGRCPHAWIDGNRLLLGNDNRLIEQNEIDAVVEQLGGFGSDNRAGIERQLHRISAIRNRESEIIGLTLRLGRHVSGNTGIISDLLSGDPTKSILFLGEPGSG